jgi:hypothetical protein
MNTPHRLAAALTLAALTALPVAAQEVPMAIQMAVGCGPQATTAPAAPSDAPRLAGSLDTSPRSLYGPNDLVTIDEGTSRGIQLGQRFFVRRNVTSYDAGTVPRVGDRSRWMGFVRRNMTYRGGATAGPHAIVTAGWVHIVSVNDSLAIAMIDKACDVIMQGDYLEPYVDPATPADADRTDTSGTLDFSMPAHVLFGDYSRQIGGAGDMMIADIGQRQGAMLGARFAVYRDLHQAGLPLAAVGEAIVVSVGVDSSLVRLTQAADAVQTGDLLIPRNR